MTINFFFLSYFCNDDNDQVELHVHLDGGANYHHTTYELLKYLYLKFISLLSSTNNEIRNINQSRVKNLSLPGDGSYQTFLDTFNDPGVPILVLFTLVLSAIQYKHITVIDKLFSE